MGALPLNELEAALAAAASGPPGWRREGFAARAAGLEHLEIHVLDRLAGVEPTPELADVEARALALADRLEATNERFLHRLRARIAAGRYTPEGLRRAFRRYAALPEREGDYDALDWLVGGLLDVEEPPDEEVEREAEMVFYQPTPARVVLAFVDAAGLTPDDLVCDLGSGLGHVAVLIALLSGARAHGVELEPAYARYAASRAAELNLDRVSFERADARAADLAGVSVFFLYTPFRGSLLSQVLGRMQAVHPRLVGTYGPCTPEVADLAPWLRLHAGCRTSERDLAIFRAPTAGLGPMAAKG